MSVEYDYDNMPEYLIIQLLKTRKIMLKDVPEKNRTYQMYLEYFNISYCEVPVEFRTYEMYLNLVKRNGFNITYVPEHLKSPEMCLLASKQCYISYIPPQFRTLEIYTNIIKNIPEDYRNVPDEFKTEEITLLAINYCDHTGYINLEHIPEKLKNENFCIKTIRQNSHIINYLPYNPRYDIIHVKSWGLPLKNPDFINYELCIISVKRKGRTLEYVPEKYKTEQVCLLAVRQTAKALEFVPPQFKNKCQEFIESRKREFLNKRARFPCQDKENK